MSQRLLLYLQPKTPTTWVHRWLVTLLAYRVFTEGLHDWRKTYSFPYHLIFFHPYHPLLSKNGGFWLLLSARQALFGRCQEETASCLCPDVRIFRGVTSIRTLVPTVRAQRLAGTRLISCLVSSVKVSPASLSSAVHRRTRLVFFSKTSCFFEELDTAWLLLLLSSPASLHRGSKDLYSFFFSFYCNNISRFNY